VIEAARYVASKGDARAQHKLPLHLEADVVLLFREREELAADGRGSVELAAGEVEAGEAAQHRKSSRHLPRFVREPERPLVDLLHLLCVAAGRHEASGETRVQRYLLMSALRRGRNRRKHAE
jgi:hypothetical protein